MRCNASVVWVLLGLSDELVCLPVQPLSYRVADKVVGTLFGIEPVFDLLSKKARSTMVSVHLAQNTGKLQAMVWS